VRNCTSLPSAGLPTFHPALPHLAEIVHLEEAVAGVDVTLHESHVGLGFTLDRRDAVLVLVDRHRVAEARQIELCSQHGLSRQDAGKCAQGQREYGKV
jgi:hypothetical protein